MRDGSCGVLGKLRSKIMGFRLGGIFLPTVWKMMYLVLLTLTDILFDINQFAHFFSCLFTLSMSSGSSLL